MPSIPIFMARVPKQIYLLIWDEYTMHAGTKEDADEAKKSLNPPVFVLKYNLEASLPQPSTS